MDMMRTLGLSPAVLLAWGLGSLAAPLQPGLEAVWLDPGTLVVSADIPEASLQMSGAEGLYGAPGRGFIRLDIPGCAQTGETGKPQLPFLSFVVDAPRCTGIEIEVKSDGRIIYDVSERVMPFPGPAPKRPGHTPVFAPDRLSYGTDAFLPEKTGEVYDASLPGGLARGHRLVAVHLHPVGYNPAAGLVRLDTKMTAVVRFMGADWSESRSEVAKTYSPAWEGLMRRLCVPPPPAAADPPISKAGDAYFDIFYGHSFQAAAARLAEWKSRLGFKVRLADAGGWTAQAVRDTIRLRQPLATYVLLISDPNAAGTDIIATSATGGSSGEQTDLYYSVADTCGYLPDLFLGRLSVRTADEADAVVGKIISYQKGDFGRAGNSWLGKALFIAGYDGSYQWLGRATNRYCHDILRREGYTVVDTLVMAQGEEQDRIVERLNQGRAWAVYTAHGSATAWSIGGYSSFTTQEVATLVHNDGMTAMVSGHCCLSNKFMYSFGDCFGEAWLKLPDRGGAAYFGSVPETYWDEDDWLQRRYFDAIYDSVPGSPGLRMTEPGRYTQYGLFWIDLNTATPKKQYYFEAYHLLGDPSAPVWTGVPRGLSVGHPSAVAPLTDTMGLSVLDSATGQPVAGATACVWSRAEPAMHRTAVSGPDGAASVPVEPGVIGDTLLVTVSAAGYRPFLSLAMVLSKMNVMLSSRTIVVNVPTGLEMTVTDPDSGSAPVCSLEVYASYNGSSGQMVATTDSSGRASFTLNAPEGGYVALSGRIREREMFRDTVRVLAPEGFLLSRAYPNPSSGAVTVDFEIPRPGRAEVRAYNVLGQLVGTVYSGSLSTGYHRFAWDGRDPNGRRLPSGVYFLSLSVEGAGMVPPRRIVLVR